ncbi:MAG: hypothetical protein ACRCYP_05105, partial [Alphaproteobacteria bacterium]
MKHLLSCFFLLLHTLAFARVLMPVEEIHRISSYAIPRGALAGALGAVTSEMLAEAIAGNPKEMATRVLGEVAERAALEGRGFSQKDYETALKEAAEVAKNVGQIGAASVALLSRQDVGTAIHTAQTATENNLIPGLIAGGLFVWSAYDLYQTAQTEGPEAALQQAGVEVVVAVVGGTAIKQGFKIAGKIYPVAEAAWAAYVAENPIMAKLGDAVASAVERGKNWVERGVGKASQKAPSRNVALEALDLEPPKIYPFSSNYWKKSDVHTFRGQTNRVHKRDDLIDLGRVD